MIEHRRKIQIRHHIGQHRRHQNETHNAEPRPIDLDARRRVLHDRAIGILLARREVAKK